MKILLLLAGAAILCSVTPHSFGQAGLPPPATSPQPYRLPELTLGQGGTADLTKALDLLAKHLRDTGQEVPNVILGAGTEQLPVPSLTLRNISGLDALQMIATATGCELERIPAADDPSRAAGWLIRVQSRSPGIPPGFFGGETGGGLPGVAAPFAGRSAAMAPWVAPQPGAPAPGTPDPNAPSGGNAFGAAGIPADVGPTGAGNNGLRGTVVSFGAPAGDPSRAVTMVYPVGGLLAEGKPSDAMSALEEALKVAIESAGLAGEKPRLSFHEKTKVLIIKGSPELQQLVGSFLDALEKNRASASAGELAQTKNEITRIRETAELRESEMSMQLKRLEVQIAELDAERRALLRRSEELEAKLPKTGPPAENPRR